MFLVQIPTTPDNRSPITFWLSRCVNVSRVTRIELEECRNTAGLAWDLLTEMWGVSSRPRAVGPRISVEKGKYRQNMFFTSWQLKAVSITFALSIILDSELPSDSWNISPHGPMALGTPEQASDHTGWIPCLADRRIDCMIAPARRQACSSTIGWWEVHARIWISRVGLSIAHWARTWIMGIHDLDPSRIPTLHCPSHTALDKDPAYHVGSSWIFVHIYWSPDPFIFVFFFYLRFISLMKP